MCRVPVSALPAGTYTPPTWLDALAPGGAVASAAQPASTNAGAAAAAASAAVAPQLQQLHVPLPAISDAELSMLDSLLNVKVEGASSAAVNAQQQPVVAAPAMKATASAPFVVAPAPPPPPAFLANVFSNASSTLPYGAVTHANASAYAAHAAAQMADGRTKRVKKVSFGVAKHLSPRARKGKKNETCAPACRAAVARRGAAFAR